jgi:hypothetical protein
MFDYARAIFRPFVLGRAMRAEDPCDEMRNACKRRLVGLDPDIDVMPSGRTTGDNSRHATPLPGSAQNLGMRERRSYQV